MTGPEIPSSCLGSPTFLERGSEGAGLPVAQCTSTRRRSTFPARSAMGWTCPSRHATFCAPTLPTSPTSHSPSSTVPPRVHQVESARGQRAAWLGRAHSPLPSRTPRLCVFLVPPATPFDTSILCACFICLYHGVTTLELDTLSVQRRWLPLQ